MIVDTTGSYMESQINRVEAPLTSERLPNSQRKL